LRLFQIVRRRCSVWGMQLAKKFLKKTAPDGCIP
jgi:hypothetical protein